MSRWKQQDATVCIFGTVNCAFGENASDARRIVTEHNADIDALTAERDELQRRLDADDGHQRALDEMHLRYNAEAERDELQRRLDAVVMEHIRTTELKCYCEFDRDHERSLECEYCEEVATLRAIAEGREP
jgi:hypothetical protein